MRRREQPVADHLPEPPDRFRYVDWEDRAAPSRTFMDAAFIVAVRKWSEAKRLYGEAAR